MNNAVLDPINNEVPVFPAARRLLSTSLLAALACAAATPTTSHAADGETHRAATLQLSSCTVPNLERPARCGTLDVAENPDKLDGRRIALKIVVVPATGAKALPDPVVFLSGGPGQAATRDAGFMSQSLSDLNADRDLLFVDQRGTGGSAQLACPMFDVANPAANLRDVFPPAAIKRCLGELSAKADLTQYSLRHFAGDLEAVRVALGYESLNLFGFSYGTRAAQVYMRIYPKTARTAFLGSLAPMDSSVLLEFPGAAEAALNGTFAACDADAACKKTFPEARKEFATLLERLDRGEVVVSAVGSKDKVTLTRGRFAERLRSMLYSTQGAATVPWMLHQAHEGNWQPFVDSLLEFTRGVDGGLDMGLFFSITCSEDVAWLREPDIEARATKNTFGDGRIRSQQAACSQWPRYSLPAGHRDAMRTDVPTILMSGEFDPATPAVLAKRAAEGYTRRAELMLRGQAHSGWSDCVGERYARFVKQGSVDGIVDDCPATPRPAFKTGEEKAETKQ